MRALVLVGAVIVALTVTVTAAADGLPVLGIDVGSQGVTAAGSPDRYVTINDGEWTIVERIARDGGRVLASQKILGTYTIPAVAYDSSASGLSADGSTLVLIQPRRAFPRASTTFALFGARKLRLEQTFTLHGDFSFDAVSPRGKKMFLINYTSPADPTRYTVRSYDLVANALVAKPVVDPAEKNPDKMRGSPITRMLSVDGRWAYTLYDGAGGEPFVHALDTATSRAHCIDLPMLALKNVWSMRFTRGAGSQIRIGTPGTALAVVDTTTFAASVPSATASSNLRPWLIAAALAALSLLIALAATRRRFRGRPAPA
jgi:hypothetical protein